MIIAVLLNTGVPWARETALALAAQGHEVHAIDFTTNKAALGHLVRDDVFQQEDIRRFSAGVAGRHWLTSAFRQNLRYLSAAPSLRQLLKRLRPDVLLTLYSGGFATLAQLSCFRPYCTWVVGSDVLLTRGIARPLLASALRSADLVLANGEHLAQATRRLAPKAPVESLLLGTNVAQFRAGPKQTAPVAIFTNRGFNPVYQNDLIVRALARLNPDLDFTFTFASAGPEFTAVTQLASKIFPAAIQARVHFTGGVNRDRMLELLAEARYFISMSRSDGTATSLLEAMAAHAYPIVSDIPQNREWVRPEWDNGRLVPFDRPEHLTGVLNELLIRPQDHTKALIRNRQQVELRANASRNIATLGHRLASLVEAHGKQT